jgi:hypothetical protein
LGSGMMVNGSLPSSLTLGNNKSTCS